MKILVLYGGTSNERDVSIMSGKSILESLKRKYIVDGYDFNGDFEKLKSLLIDYDLIFNALHGGDGENGVVQKFLENNNILFTGSSSFSSSIAMNKHKTKKIVIDNSLITPDWVYIDNVKNKFSLKKFFGKSIVIKPADEGSSIGLTIIENFNNDKMNKLNVAIENSCLVSDKILIEEYIDGKELTVGVLGDVALPALEIIPDNTYYDYECKYSIGKSQYKVPANISNDISEKLKSISLKIFKLLGCCNYARVDFRLSNENKIYFLEINTLPGFTSTSLFPKAANAASLDYDHLLDEIIALAKK